jgi:hypothetical protein
VSLARLQARRQAAAAREQVRVACGRDVLMNGVARQVVTGRPDCSGAIKQSLMSVALQRRNLCDYG